MATTNKCITDVPEDSNTSFSVNSSTHKSSSAATSSTPKPPARDNGALNPFETFPGLPSTVCTLEDINPKDVVSVIPKRKMDVVKWNGWGYKDCEFYSKDYFIRFRGNRYPLKEGTMPFFTKWVMDKFNATLHYDPPKPNAPEEYLKPTVNHKFLEELKSSSISHSVEWLERLHRCHCQSMRDIYYLVYNKFERVPDVVTWPSCHDDVVKLVDMANRHDVVLLPFGGGTSVSGASSCPQKENRMICSLDTTQMNRMLWLNKANLTVCFEAGIVGQDLDRTMHEMGLTVGHEPDSYEFSTLGGWVATRASGMKKNVYGNIEDLVLQVRMVTPTGVLERNTSASRISSGPDFQQIILGSEGTLGVITEVVLKVRPLPPVKRYNCLVFPDFENGLSFMREIAEKRCQPASVRLMDNEQFVFGQSLKPPKDFKGKCLDYLKDKYITVIKGIDMNQLCAATLLFEGDKAEVDRQEKQIISIAKKHYGFAGGSQNGERGYIMTFVVAYIRDLALVHDILCESFETCVPWNRCLVLCRNVKRRLELECHAKSILHFTVSYRITQTYDAGACIYFYYGFNARGFDNPLELFEYLEACARDEILLAGGSISHHHGIGKVRAHWYESAVSKTGTELFKATKHQLDPNNIFATGNILPQEEWDKWATKLASTSQARHLTNNRAQSKL